MKVNGKWYPAGSEIAAEDKAVTDSETKTKRGRLPKSDAESK